MARDEGISQGLSQALKLIELEIALDRRHRKSLAKLRGDILPNSDLRLHLGCGPNRKQGWVNIDLFAQSADFQLDLREEWPFAPDSVSNVYSEHVFEHFDFPLETGHFLSEAIRVLKPGGVFDVAVPDTEWPLTAYGDDTNDYWKKAKELWHPHCRTQLEHINYHFRQGSEHKYAWDFPTLKIQLETYGFVSVERRSFEPSLDTEARRLGSLYMRAQKRL